MIEGLTGESFHRVDLVFLCRYEADIPAAKISEDTNQAGVDWLRVEDLEKLPLYPSRLRKQIVRLYNAQPYDVYLGNESMDSQETEDVPCIQEGRRP